MIGVTAFNNCPFNNFQKHCTKNEIFHWGFLQWMWPNPQEITDLVTFTEEILNGKLHFLCSKPWSKLKKINPIKLDVFWIQWKPGKKCVSKCLSTFHNPCKQTDSLSNYFHFVCSDFYTLLKLTTNSKWEYSFI